MTRHEVLGQAVDQCMKELYSLAQPSIDWEDFIKENKEYVVKEKAWEQYKRAFANKDENPEMWKKMKDTFPEWEDKSIKDCIGPKPYEFYYLPREVMNEVCDSYVYAYNIDSKQQLLDTIETLKNYCKEPVVDKYIEGKGKPGDEDYEPGHRGYDHPNNLVTCLMNCIIGSNLNLGDNTGRDIKNLAEQCQDRFFTYLDMAGNFYNWNRDLNSFNMSVYLGASPNSNKEAVIENWKKYRDTEIEIDETKYDNDDYDE